MQNENFQDAELGHLSRDVSTSEIDKVGIRVPPFYADDSEICFAQLEGKFALANIKNDVTKFYDVIGHIEHMYAKEIIDIILNAPAMQKYVKLKSELINRLSASKTSKIKQLLTLEELGNRKPTQIHRHLRNLAGQDFLDEYLQTIRISRLPLNVQTVLAAEASASLENQAGLADRVMEVAAPIAQIYATATSFNEDNLIDEVKKLRNELMPLK